MKKLNLSIRSLFILCLAAVSVAANAQQVSQEEAANIALQFLKGNGSQNSRLKKATPEALKLVYTEPSAKDKSANLYVYNMEGGGFAIVSADARTGSQILGYSFDNNFSAKGMPDNVKFWLGEYSRQIDFIKAHQPEVSESKRRERLKMYDAPTPPENVSIVVHPLLKTTWGQSAPYYGMTPTLKNSQQEYQHTVTGCVATAMAQIMNYWHWPAQGKGKHTYYWTGGTNYISSDFSSHKYDWKNMTDSYNENLSYESNNTKMKAVAQLMYDCGVAVDMDYGLESSGAYDDDVVPALTSYFGYSHNISLRHQSEFANNDAGWIKLLTDELDADRPVYYAAEDATENDDDAHAFVLDGYGTIKDEKTSEDITYFHINWGWDGYDGFGNKDTANGYFAMTAFNPWYRESLYTEGEHEGEPEIDKFNQNSVAIIGIQPAEDSELTFENLADGWDKDGNWGDEEDFGTGKWSDYTIFNVPYDDPKSTNDLSLYRQQNLLYNDIYKIIVTGWEGEADQQEYDNYEWYKQNDTDDNSLVFYWNSKTNECYLPTQYTGLMRSSTQGQNTEIGYQLYANPSDQGETVFGNYDPFTKVFSLNFYSYALSLKTKATKEAFVDISNTENGLIKESDPEKLLEYFRTLKDDDPYPDASNPTHTINISESEYDEQYEFNKILGKSTISYYYKLFFKPSSGNLTLTPDDNAPQHKGLYLDDFTEQNDGTATQVAGFYYEYDAEEPEDKFYYRIGLMPVNENTSKSALIDFAQNLNGDLFEVTQDLPYNGTHTFEKISEGAYYVVVAHYDDAQGENFISYEYMPVFFSKEENWDDIGSCLYDDHMVEHLYGGNYSDLGLEYNVNVWQYNGTDLIRNEGDRIFRVENPYSDVFHSTMWNNSLLQGRMEHFDIYPDDNDSFEDYYREDVYLYLYVDADNNVSLYPDYFEFQPLGIDWDYGEMLLFEKNKGEYDAVNNKIIFNQGYDFDIMEYFDEYYYDSNTEDDKFSILLPSTLKNYLTLHDDEPYTFTDEDIEGLPKYSGVYYSRELDSNNNWGTLMLPFKYNTGDIDDFSFYELTEIETHDNETSALVFTQIAEDKTVEANTPVIFKRDAGPEKNLEVSGVVEDGFVELVGCGETGIIDDYHISNLNDNKDWLFIGVYNSGAIRAPKDPSAYNELTKCYFFEDDCILNVTAAMYLYQYRGYFKDNSTNGGGAKRIPVRFNDEEYTSLDALFNGEQPVRKYGKGRFNLQGQAVGKDYKGVVIEDGRKKISY